MSPTQQFRLGRVIESLALRTDVNGTHYSQMNDITDIFPGALRFKVKDVNILFLENEHGRRYEPRRIAYYPNEIVDIVTATHASGPFASMVSKKDDSVSMSTPTLSSNTSSNSQALAQPIVQLLQGQTDAKQRDECVLAELAEAKKRDEEIHRLQKQTIDKLTGAQQRIEAILVQNYELHEYPIPRLFVILPDSYEKWDPRNFLTERFRLYFLCECGDHCKTDADTITTSGQPTIAATTPFAPVPVKNSIHLAKHDGYELSRPTEFFDRYGPYIQGVLQALRHCLTVAAGVTPVVALAESGVKEINDEVKLIFESTREAVDMSIDFLEKRLGDGPLADEVNSTNAEAQEENAFSGLAALEGADLRQLDTFLRRTDSDKILGNLYRITTDAGHVKWVCLDHYHQVYRETTLTSFRLSVETNGGVFDPQLGKVTLSFKSSTLAKDFFTRLSKQGAEVKSLSIKLDWSFASADLLMLVEKISQSNIGDLELDLQDDDQPLSIPSQLRPKGRYHALLALFSNTKIKGLTFSNVAFIGSRTSNLPSHYSPSLLQSFHYLGRIYSIDDSRLASIIALCPQLVDLRLGAQVAVSEGVPKVDHVIGSLSKLKVLHRYNLYPRSSTTSKEDSISRSSYGSVPLRELVEFGFFYYSSSFLLEDAVTRSLATLEVLLFNYHGAEDNCFHLRDIADLLQSPVHPGCQLPFGRLTRLELCLQISTTTFNLMAIVLPRLPLVYFGVDERNSSLLAHVNLNTLRTLSVRGMAEYELEYLCRAISLPSQIESLSLESIPIKQTLMYALETFPLRRLSLKSMDLTKVAAILPRLNDTQLQVLTIIDDEYDWETNTSDICHLGRPGVIQRVYQGEKSMRDALQEDGRKESDYLRSDTFSLRSRKRVRVVSYATYQREHYSHILPTSSR
ncbi:hypothetical protein BGZ96_004627 [Linnemannia gamsii]|uniref:RNI-like protein n=1 Tax=Linnemannia gamsii TaxID=64522 RepID=A0ABQ7K5D5_9FUNG|nr:hypothetical protein BGZ96_004627 [Linnemannia gamsii]